MRILAISGSLRAASSNAAILRAAASLVPAGVDLVPADALGRLPHFNPDLDGEGAVAPAEVAALRGSLAAADAVVICSPEYAHGAPGVLKNALDWLVSDATLVGKSVAVITAGPTGAPYAHAQLVETLRTMSWHVVEAAGLRLILGRAQLDAHGDLADAALRDRLRGALAALSAAAGRGAV